MQIHIRLNRDSAYWGEWGNDLDRAQEVYAEALRARGTRRRGVDLPADDGRKKGGWVVMGT